MQIIGGNYFSEKVFAISNRVMLLLWYVTAKGKWYGFAVSTKMRNFAIDKILSLTYVLW